MRAKKKLSFVEGLIPKLKSCTSKEEDWWTINKMMGLWILNTIELSLRTTISYGECCDKIWGDLKEQFMLGNGAKKT